MASDEKDRFGDKLRDAERAKEEQFFAEQDRKLLEKMRQARGEEVKEVLREVVQMRCPKCGVHLQHAHEQGVGVEECPRCRGMWIDHGDLQQIAGREKDGWIARWLRGEFRKPE